MRGSAQTRIYGVVRDIRPEGFTYEAELGAVLYAESSGLVGGTYGVSSYTGGYVHAGGMLQRGIRTCATLCRLRITQLVLDDIGESGSRCVAKMVTWPTELIVLTMGRPPQNATLGQDRDTGIQQTAGESRSRGSNPTDERRVLPRRPRSS